MKSLKRQFKILKSVKPDETKREEFFKLIAEMSADYRTPSFSRRYFAVFSRSVPALALISALFLAASGTGITFASQNTLPGEALYPAKLAIEKIMVAAAGNVEKKNEMTRKKSRGLKSRPRPRPFPPFKSRRKFMKKTLPN